MSVAATGKVRVAAKESWYSLDPANPHLIGSKCKSCSTYAFPAETVYCKNPACDSTEFEQVPLSRWGKIWSYTNACYQPPAPYVVLKEPYQPFALAAVELPEEKLIVLGQLVDGVGVADVKIGDEVELVLGTQMVDGDKEVVVWRWLPTGK